MLHRPTPLSCVALSAVMLQVVLLPDCAGPGGHPTRDELAAMVLAGGGCVVPPAQAGQPGAADVAIVSAQAAATASCIRPLLQAQVRTWIRVLAWLAVRYQQHGTRPCPSQPRLCCKASRSW